MSRADAANRGRGRAGAAARGALVAITLVVGLTTGLSAHDLFFRLPSYLVAPLDDVRIDVLSGTFSRSENAVTRDRLTDLSLVTSGGRKALDRSLWHEHDRQSALTFRFEAPGTYLLGAAIAPRMLALPATEFNAYLKEEGLTEVIAERTATGRLREPSRERYSKYVKTLFQIGDETTEAWSSNLGYEAEIIPEANPYRLQAGDHLRVRCLVEGQPWAGKVVFAGGRRGTSDERLPQQRLTTDADGRATIVLTDAGVWFVKFVAMKDVRSAEANYESRWSTLSFAVGAGQSAPRTALAVSGRTHVDLRP